MADQISKIKSKRQVFQLKSPHLCLQTLMVGLFMLALSICSVQTAICSPSVPSSAGITTEQYTFDLYYFTLNLSLYLVKSCVTFQDIIRFIRMDYLTVQCLIVSTTCTGYNQKRRGKS